jgi:hypothetical protein
MPSDARAYQSFIYRYGPICQNVVTIKGKDLEGMTVQEHAEASLRNRIASRPGKKRIASETAKNAPGQCGEDPGLQSLV